MVCSIIVESKYFFLTCYDDWFIFKMYTIYTKHSCTPITQSYFLILFSHITNASPDYSCLALCPSVYGYGYQGAVSIRKTVLPGMAIPMLKIRRPNGRLIFNMENAIRR